MNKVIEIETFIQNIINYQDFFNIDAFFDNIPISCILTAEDLRFVKENNSQYIVLGPELYTSHQILNKFSPSINYFHIYQGYAVTGNDSYWYKINKELSEYITKLNLEICSQMINNIDTS